MMPVHFAVAKYVPDLRRMEPHNIGVIVWSAGEVAARFLAERVEQPGDVDGRSVPNFVTSTNAYKQWVRFWRKELEKSDIRPLDGGEAVSRSSVDFLRVLASMSKDNFLLVESGMLLDRVEVGGLPDVADYLFRFLVEEVSTAEEPRDPSLEEVCQRLIEETHLDAAPYFHRNYPLTCRVPGDATETFEFSYAYGNGSPVRLYQHLPLPRRRYGKNLKRNVHHVAWMFEKVIDQKVIAPEQGGVLIYPTPDQLQDDEVQKSLRMLSSMTRILDLQNYNEVRKEFESLAALDVAH
jgi:hypothetical protein